MAFEFVQRDMLKADLQSPAVEPPRHGDTKAGERPEGRLENLDFAPVPITPPLRFRQHGE